MQRRRRNNVLCAINFVAMALSIPIIGCGVWLATESDNSCVKFLQWPIIILGTLILVVAITGFIGSFWRVQCLIISYFITMLFLIILLSCLVVAIYLVTIRGSGHLAPMRGYMEYRLEEFSGRLKRIVQSSYRWDRIRSCLSSTSICDELDQQYRIAQDFFNASLSSLQTGCCKPPTECGFTFVNPTYWISPINTAAGMDCLQWNNNQTQLCYTCDSCKAGLLANLKKEWRKIDIILFATLVALKFVYVFGFCAFKNYKNIKADLSCERKQNSA